MDYLEKNAFRETIHNYSLQGEHNVATKKRLLRLKDATYFGRIDFETNKKTRKIYVGVHNFQNSESDEKYSFIIIIITNCKSFSFTFINLK